MKLVFYICFLSLMAQSRAFADAVNYENTLIEAMENGERKVKEEFLTEIKSDSKETRSGESKVSEDEEPKYPSFYKKRPLTSDERILKLLDQVEGLKAKVVQTKLNVAKGDSLEKHKKVATKTIFNFSEGKIFDVYAGVDRVTDIELQSSETLTDAPLSGDTVRWKIGVLTSGSGSNLKTHLILKPLEENIETNIVIPTTKRVYHIRAVSGDWYMPSVAWNYPDENAQEVEAFLAREREIETVGIAPDKLNFGYKIEGDDYSWEPIRVFDDGAKTYFQMPQKMSVTEAPVLFVIDDESEPMLVNYRVKGAYYIIDRLIMRAQMRVGKSAIVSIYSDEYKKSLFERIF